MCEGKNWIRLDPNNCLYRKLLKLTRRQKLLGSLSDYQFLCYNSAPCSKQNGIQQLTPNWSAHWTHWEEWEHANVACVCVCVCVWLRLTACWHDSTVAARGLFHGTVILRVENLPPSSALKLSFRLTRHHPTKTQEISKLYVSPQVEIVLKGEFRFMASHHQLHKFAYFLCPSYRFSLLCQKLKNGFQLNFISEYSTTCPMNFSLLKIKFIRLQ